MRRSRVRTLWSNPGNPPAAVARALGMAPRDLSGADRVIIYSDGSVTMSRANRLAISTTKTDVRADRKAFVTLRFAGDNLDPDEISAILPIKPTRAHRKGEEFVAGPHAGTLHGRTGIWFLATDKLVPSDN